MQQSVVVSSVAIGGPWYEARSWVNLSMVSPSLAAYRLYLLVLVVILAFDLPHVFKPSYHTSANEHGVSPGLLPGLSLSKTHSKSILSVKKLRKSDR